MAKTDFLNLNAYAIKDLITRKLSQDSRFTDQIYEGSNLAILIDIFSYMAQNLLYCLNNAAAESMFSDTQIYENINRLCNFIGYNPRGMSPSMATFFPIPDEENAQEGNVKSQILKYSFINTGKTDSKGKTVYYSVGDEDINFVNTDYKFTMYNGIWKVYREVYSAEGIPWESFTLHHLKSSYTESAYVAHGFINVYAVVYNTDRSIKETYLFKPTSEQLFKIPHTTYKSDADVTANNGILFSGILSQHNTGKKPNSLNSNVFNLRLNERKEYEITFGDGSTGALLPKGAAIYIVYLDTNGLEGELDANFTTTAKISQNRLGLSDSICDAIFGITDKTNVALFTGEVSNDGASTHARLEEDVETIKKNAPAWFRMGNRLVTKNDYEYYIKNTPLFSSAISDVKCMNNWEYISTFYKWLYDLGVRYHDDPRYYLNQNQLIKNDYKVADPADSNNVYLWCIMNSENQSDDLLNDTRFKNALNPIKDLTQEPVFLKAVTVNFEICAAPEETAKKYFKNGNFEDFNRYSFLEVTLDDDALYSNTMIARQVADKILNYFSAKNQRIGTLLNYSDLMNAIYSIDGIQRLRTVYFPIDENGNQDPTKAIVYNGIAFASWTAGLDGLLDLGVDLEVSNSTRALEPFQFARLNDETNIVKNIRVIKKSFMSMNNVEY